MWVARSRPDGLAHRPPPCYSCGERAIGPVRRMSAQSLPLVIVMEDDNISCTTELRWFFGGDTPLSVAAWFASDALSPHDEDLQIEEDHYLWTATADVSLKIRGGRLEQKKRVAQRHLAVAGVAGTVERWERQSRPEQASDEVRSLVTIVEKRRRLTHFEERRGLLVAVPRPTEKRANCTLELAAVKVPGQRFWTVCVEATEGDGAFIEHVLVLMVKSFPPEHLAAFTGPRSMGYPQWLLEHGRRPRVSREEAAASLPRVL